MTEVRFYHLTSKPLAAALPEILQKAITTDRRVVVKVPDAQQAEKLNEHLWTFKPDSFLPHGTKKDGHAEHQPVWITDSDENPNGAKILVLTLGSTSEIIGDFDLCCEMLDGNNAEAVKAARARWKDYKEAGYDLTYWQQNEKGGWDKKAA